MAVLTGLWGRGRSWGAARKSVACSSPTGRPPPSTGVAARRAKGEVSTSSAARTRTVTGIRARSPPSETFTARARPSGRPTSWTPSKPSLASRPGTRRISAVTSRSSPATISGWRRMARPTAASASPALFRRLIRRGGRGQAAEGAGHAAQREREERGAAAVSGGALRVFTGQVRHGPGHQLLQRVRRVQVALDRPAVDDAGGRHGGMLSGAVLRQLGGLAAAAEPVFALAGAVGEVGAVLEVRGRQAVQLQDAPRRRHGGWLRRNGWRRRGRGVRPGGPARRGPWRRPAGASGRTAGRTGRGARRQ